jgi:hypothetical protein
MAEVRKSETLESTVARLVARLARVEAIASSPPDTPLAWELANQSVTVSSGTFVPVAHVELPRYDGAVLNVRSVVACDAGTSGEVRIRQELTGAATDAAAVGPGVSQQFVDFEWLHGLSLGDTYEHFIIEARRTAGAGNVTCFYPRRSIISTALRFPSATADGNPTVF